MFLVVCVEGRFQLCDGRYESLLRQKRNVSGLGGLSEQATQDETEKRKELLRIKISGERTALIYLPMCCGEAKLRNRQPGYIFPPQPVPYVRVWLD